MAKPKFGVFLPFYAFPKEQPARFQQLKTVVLECERLGYDSVWLDDHLMYGDWQILESWTALSALAAQTSTIRLGTMVNCVMHRNPALLAKAAATLDVISNGRLEFGVGAGVQVQEHLAYGFGFPKLGVRAERLAEALKVITRLWTEKQASFVGKHYTLKNAVCEPKPIQKPHPPITVGGSSQKTLKVTAKYADRFDWGFIPSIDEYKRKLAALEHACKSVGRTSGEIERSCWPAGQILIAADEMELSEKIKKAKPSGMSLEDFEKTTLAATPDSCLERLEVYRDLDVSYFMLFFADLPSSEGLRLFSEAVAERLS